MSDQITPNDKIQRRPYQVQYTDQHTGLLRHPHQGKYEPVILPQDGATARATGVSPLMGQARNRKTIRWA